MTDTPLAKTAGLRRYLLTLRRFWGTALAGQLEYQANVWIELLAMVANLAGSVLLLSLFFPKIGRAHV